MSPCPKKKYPQIGIYINKHTYTHIQTRYVCIQVLHEHNLNVLSDRKLKFNKETTSFYRMKLIVIKEMREHFKKKKTTLLTL